VSQPPAVPDHLLNDCASVSISSARRFFERGGLDPIAHVTVTA